MSPTFASTNNVHNHWINWIIILIAHFYKITHVEMLNEWINKWKHAYSHRIKFSERPKLHQIYEIVHHFLCVSNHQLLFKCVNFCCQKSLSLLILSLSAEYFESIKSQNVDIRWTNLLTRTYNYKIAAAIRQFIQTRSG